MLEQVASAVGTGLLGGDVPCAEVAVRIVVTAVEDIAAAGFSLNDLAAALRADGAGINNKGLCVLALRVAGAGEELAVAAGLDDHHAAAFFAGDVGLVLFELDFLALHVLFGLGEGTLQLIVELP